MDQTRVSRGILVGALAATLALACKRSGDSAGGSDFNAMQTRGAHVMGVDQYTSAHVFEDLPDGGRVVLERDDSADTAAIATIRGHMREIAASFRAGDFTKPFQVHAQTVPGTAVMRDRRAKISYVPIYAWRHSWITDALIKGIPVEVVAELVGNSPQIIYENYAHVFKRHDALREAALKAVS